MILRGMGVISAKVRRYFGAVLIGLVRDLEKHSAACLVQNPLLSSLICIILP